MRICGSLSGPYKHARAVAAQVDSRQKIGGRFKPYRWPIEGEELTLEQISARLPHIKPKTIEERIGRGDRTWDRLGRPLGERTPQQQEASKTNARRIRNARNVANERREYLRRLNDGNAKL